MTFDEIQAAISVYRFKNFFDAANHNSVSPSTLSKQIAHIEQELGVTLFNRATKKNGAELTPAGKAMMPYLEKLSATMAEAKMVAKNFQKKETYDFRIGYSPSIGTMGEAKLFSSFIVNNEDIHLHFVPETNEKLVEYLYSGLVDALILTVPEWDLVPGSPFYEKLYNPAVEIIELRRSNKMMLETSRYGEFAGVNEINDGNMELLQGKTILLNNRSPYIKYVDRIKARYGLEGKIGVRYMDFDKAGVIHTILLDNPDMAAPFIGVQSQREYLWKNIPVTNWDVTTYQYLLFLKTNKTKPIKIFKEETEKHIEILDTTGLTLPGK